MVRGPGRHAARARRRGGRDAGSAAGSPASAIWTPRVPTRARDDRRGARSALERLDASIAERRRIERGCPARFRRRCGARRERRRRACLRADALASLAPVAAACSDELRRLPGCARMPTLRELPTLAASSRASTAARRLRGARRMARARACRPQARQRAAERIARSSAWRCSATSSRAWSTTSSTTRRATCSPSATTSSERRRDASYYDLLASEARLAQLRRRSRRASCRRRAGSRSGACSRPPAGEPVLLSWSGSMFEYLMPLLVMPTYENTLLDQTCRAAVERQIEYGKQRGVPWGISESGYNAVDASLNYQYRAFGVPGLGLKRGLAEDLVVAPYASALALMVAPEAACRNLQRLAAEGLAGRFGFYEAIDYTPARLPRGQTSAVVRSFMAHHQGMSLLSLALRAARPADAEALRVGSAVPGDACCCCRSACRRPRALYSHAAELVDDARDRRAAPETPVRVLRQPRHADAGSAAAVERPLSRHGHERGRRLQPLEGPRGHALARRRHVRQLGHVLLPARRGERRVLVDRAPADAASAPTHYEAIFTEGARRIPPPRRRHRDAHRDRRLAGRRHRAAPRPHHQPLAHAARRSRSRATRRSCWRRRPRTRCIRRSAICSCRPRSCAARQAILCTRRPRSRDEQPPWMFHLMAVHGAESRGRLLRDRSHALHRSRPHASPRRRR